MEHKFLLLPLEPPFRSRYIGIPLKKGELAKIILIFNKKGFAGNPLVGDSDVSEGGWVSVKGFSKESQKKIVTL